MRYVQEQHGLSQRRASQLAQCNRRTARYISRRRNDSQLAKRLKDLAYINPALGYRMLCGMVRLEGWPVNHKKVYRLTCPHLMIQCLPETSSQFPSLRVPIRASWPRTHLAAHNPNSNVNAAHSNSDASRPAEPALVAPTKTLRRPKTHRATEHENFRRIHFAGTLWE